MGLQFSIESLEPTSLVFYVTTMKCTHQRCWQLLINYLFSCSIWFNNHPSTAIWVSRRAWRYSSSRWNRSVTRILGSGVKTLSTDCRLVSTHSSNVSVRVLQWSSRQLLMLATGQGTMYHWSCYLGYFGCYMFGEVDLPCTRYTMALDQLQGWVTFCLARTTPTPLLWCRRELRSQVKFTVWKCLLFSTGRARHYWERKSVQGRIRGLFGRARGRTIRGQPPQSSAPSFRLCYYLMFTSLTRHLAKRCRWYYQMTHCSGRATRIQRWFLTWNGWKGSIRSM